MGWYHWDGYPASPAAGTTAYTYDAVNRLNTVTLAGQYTQTFNYGQFGNMACTSGSNYCDPTITFDLSTNRISTTGYTYDAAGNLTRDGTGTGTHSFEWNAFGQMKTVDGGSTATFIYSPSGRRAQKTINGTSAYYYFDAFGNLAAVVNSSGQKLEYIIPGADSKYYWTGSAWETDFMHGNHLGSTQIVTKADNSNEEARIFFPFGKLRWQGGGSHDVRFAGMQDRDVETSSWQDPLDPTANRTYGENLGRWFSPDPLGGNTADPQSLNAYSYARNSPTTLTDPSGLDSCDQATDPFTCTLSFTTGSDESGLMGWGIPSSPYGGLLVPFGTPFAPGFPVASDLVTGGPPIIIYPPSSMLAAHVCEDADDFYCNYKGERVGPGPGAQPSADFFDLYFAGKILAAGGLLKAGIGMALARAAESEGELITLGLDQSTTDTQGVLQRLADETLEEIGPGKGAAYGSRFHKVFADKVRAVDNPNLLAEQSYFEEESAGYGDPGSIRVDVVEVLDGEPLKPIRVWDLKTGSAVLKQSRILKIVEHLPQLHVDIPIYVIMPK